MSKKTVAFSILGMLILAGLLYSLGVFKPKEGTVAEQCQKNHDTSPGCIQILVDKGILGATACRDINDAKLQSACYAIGARSSGDSSICNQITDNDWKKYCNVIVKKDHLLCNTLLSTDPIFKDYWVKNCYEDLARSSGDVKICNNLSQDYRVVECYANTAYYNSNISLCDRLEKATDKKDCKTQYKNRQQAY